MTDPSRGGLGWCESAPGGAEPQAAGTDVRLVDPDARPRFFAGFHRCLPALADTGNDLIVEHVIEFPAWRDELSRLLAHLDVFLIGMHCDLEELDRRERSRGDLRIGEGRGHVEEDLIHTFGPYDLEVDTTAGVSTTLTESVLRAWRNRTPPRALSPAPAGGIRRRSPRQKSASRYCLPAEG